MNLLAAIAALAIVYLCGYVTGSLLVAPDHDRTTVSQAVVRLLSGLFLSSIAFLLALDASLPWWSGPLAVLAAALVVHGRKAAAVPPPAWHADADTWAAALLATIALLPPVVSAVRMAPGPFPPVFFNVDVPYFLEKVHALVAATNFPPESLSVAGGRRPYHYGLHAIAALIARGSTAAPHHVVFLLLVPLLVTGITAAAFMLASAVAPRMPRVISVPLLVASAPTLWYDFWRELAPAVSRALSSGSLDGLEGAWRNWQLWGLTSNIQNLGGHFLTLATLGALASPAIGPRLPVFLVGTAIIFKSPAGVALAAGFGLAQAWRSVAGRSLAPLGEAVAAAAVFSVVYGAFWVLPPVPPELEVTVDPFFYLDFLRDHGGIRWFLADVAWLVLPALVALGAAPRTESTAGAPARFLALILFAAGPLIVVNVFRLTDLRGFLTNSMNEDDWRQVVMPVPLILHALAVAVMGARWSGLGTAARRACGVAALTAVVLPAVAGLRYSQLLLADPSRGHEFADNRAIAAALGVIPTTNTLIVTNDLRYPADGFQRDDRQMQIPALFGHRAFAVNYVYEAYSFSQERLALQRLLKQPEWSPAIDDAARAYGWTHLLVRRDYPHPDSIPLSRVFENAEYAVYVFGPRLATARTPRVRPRWSAPTVSP